METQEPSELDTRALGLIADPFLAVEDGSANAAGIKLAVRSGALRLMTALEASTQDPTHKPIVIEKAAMIPAYYPVASMALAMKALVDGVPIPRTIPAYIPLDMMRVGRVRALLNVIAERVGGNKPDVVIGTWSRRALENADTSLPEWQALESSGVDVAALLLEIDTDPAAFCARVFGPLEESREGADDFESLMRVSTSRIDKLDTDPEGDNADLTPEAEDNPEDTLAEVFTVPLGEMDEASLPEGAGDKLPELLLGDYITAYTKAHLSPVVARGIRAYRAQGFASMTEELKISKAPTKSLTALFEFSKGVFDSGVVIYDRLEMWENVPPELRSKIVATLTELRWNLKDNATMVLILVKGAAPEIEEGFASATHIEWTFGELEKVASDDSPFDVEIARHWLESASIGGVPAWGDAALESIPEGTTLDLACRALSRAIGEAVATGASQVSPALVLAALAAEKEDAAV